MNLVTRDLVKAVVENWFEKREHYHERIQPGIQPGTFRALWSMYMYTLHSLCMFRTAICLLTVFP